MNKNYDSLNLAGKVALITGGASGMGREIALAFASLGARVAVGDINESGLQSLQDEIGKNGTTQLTDVTDEQQVAALVEHTVSRFGRLDIGINCAGGPQSGPLLDIDAATWQRNLDLNLKGVFLCLKHQAAQMCAQANDEVKANGGVIINLSSVTASLAAVGAAPYACAKAAVHHLTRIAAEEFRDLRIRVLAVAPGLIRTPLAAQICDHPDLLATYMTKVPCARPGEVAEIASTVLFLASDQAAYINGTVIHVDGGQTANGGWADVGQIREHYRPTPTKES